MAFAMRISRITKGSTKAVTVSSPSSNQASTWMQNKEKEINNEIHGKYQQWNVRHEEPGNPEVQQHWLRLPKNRRQLILPLVDHHIHREQQFEPLLSEDTSFLLHENSGLEQEENFTGYRKSPQYATDNISVANLCTSPHKWDKQEVERSKLFSTWLVLSSVGLFARWGLILSLSDIIFYMPLLFEQQQW